MPRTTTLSLAELLKELSMPTDRRCEGLDRTLGLSMLCIINEVGHIFWKGGPEAMQAEKALAELLSHPDEGVRDTANVFLTTGDHVKTAATVAALQGFMRATETARIPVHAS